MKVQCRTLECMHLDPGYALLSVQNCMTCLELFRMMDIHNNSSLNDVQFDQFLLTFTDLTKKQISTVFELLDIDQSGEMEFDEFYLVFCILISCKDQYEKEFIYRHSSSIFRLIDADNSGLISSTEFSQMGVLFNFDYNSILSIFNEFDVSGDKNLDFGEFRLFTMACIDEQRSNDANLKVKSLTNYHMRLLYSLSGLITGYIRCAKVPLPRHCEAVLNAVQPPDEPDVKRRFSFWDWKFIKSKISIVCMSIITTFCGALCLTEGAACYLCCSKCRLCCKKLCKCSCTDHSRSIYHVSNRKTEAAEAHRRQESLAYYYRSKRAEMPQSEREFVPVENFPGESDDPLGFHRKGDYKSKSSVSGVVSSVMLKTKHPGQGHRKVAMVPK